MKLHFIHRVDKNNLGDYYSSPYHYYDFTDFETHVHDIGQFKRNKNLKKLEDGIIVIGGGGLLNRHSFKAFGKIMHLDNPKVIWGIGFHDKACKTLRLFNKSDMCGIRDFIKEERYLPCASCKLGGLDKYNIIDSEKIVFYSHFQYKIRNVNAKYSHYDTHSFNLIDDLLKFLGDSKIVVTSSYHGAYWAQLMNKKVILVPWGSEKFHYFKNTPIKSNNLNYNSHLDLNFELDQNLDFLKESRELNDNFYKDFMKSFLLFDKKRI